jgi:hypothetical protein
MLMEVRLAAYAMGILSRAEAIPDLADESSSHALVLNESGKPLGCARITSDGKAERMAVLPVENRHEIESALKLAALLIQRVNPRFKQKLSM